MSNLDSRLSLGRLSELPPRSEWARHGHSRRRVGPWGRPTVDEHECATDNAHYRVRFFGGPTRTPRAGRDARGNGPAPTGGGHCPTFGDGPIRPDSFR